MKIASLPTFLRLVIKAAPAAFTYSLLLYLLLVLLENVFPGFVTNTVDLNLFLIPVVLTGVGALFAPEVPVENPPPSRRDYTIGMCTAIVGGLLIYYKTKDLGMTSVVISLLSSLLIGLVHVINLQPT